MEPLDLRIFDADNHLYETRDALTKYLPERYQREIEFVEVRGRTWWPPPAAMCPTTPARTPTGSPCAS
jgi:hypothetical protein